MVHYIRPIVSMGHYGVTMMIRRIGAAAGLTVVAGVFTVAAVLPATASQTGTPSAGDDQATSHDGNATTCAGAGLDGTIVIKDDSPDTQYITIDPKDIPAGIELTGIVVKGGDAYNLYPPTVLTQLHAPLVGQDKHIPTISHWFACGVQTGETTTTTTTTTTTSTTTGGDTETSSSTTTSDAVGGAGTGGDDTDVADAGLAATGFSATGPLVGAAALLLLGGGLVLGVRRGRRQQG